MIRSRRISITAQTVDQVITINPIGLDPQLDVEFSATLSLTSESNRATVRVINLAATTRKSLSGVIRRDVNVTAAKLDLLDAGISAALRAPDVIRTATVNTGNAYLTIDAGWGDRLTTIFAGSSQRITHVKQGPHWITDFEVSDGLATSIRAVARKEFPPNAKLFDVLDHLRKCMGLSAGNFSETKLLEYAGSSALLLPFGYTAFAEARFLMSEFLSPLNITWFVDQGALYILKIGTALDDAPIDISFETGLIMSPQLTEDGLLSVQTLMNPEIRPGYRVAIRGVDFEGTYRVDSVTHKMSNKTGLTLSDVLVRAL